MNKTKVPVHYAWRILVMCCALQAGSQGTIFDTCGVFTNPVCAELGFDVGKFTMAQTFGAIAMMIAQPLTAYAYKKFDMRGVLLISGAVYYLSHFSLSFATQVWHWYVLMAIQGIAGGFFYRISYTILICHWFTAKTATALGITTAVGSIMGMIMNLVAAAVIGSWGWRSGYMCLAVVGAAITLPVIFVVLRPDRVKASRPYGDAQQGPEKVASAGLHTGKAAGAVSALLILAAGVSFFCGGYYPHLSNYCVTAGLGLAAGSVMTSFELGGTTVIKFVIGPILHKIGFIKTVLLMAALSVAGYAAYFVFEGNVLFFTTALCGIYCSTTAMVLMPLFAREQVGEERFVRILPWMTTIGGAISSLSNTLYGFLFDGAGNYRAMFCICIVSIVVSFVMILVISKLKPQNVKTA